MKRATGVEWLGGSYFAYCYSCEWTGPFRRWAWRARWDGRRHVRHI